MAIRLIATGPTAPDGHGRRPRGVTLGARLAASLLLLVTAMVTTTPAHAAAHDLLLDGADWLGGNGVDVYEDDGNVPNQYHGVAVGEQSITTGEKWQCVELINRLYLVQEWIDSTWSGNGNQMYGTAPAGLVKSGQGSISTIQPGDVLVWDDTPANPAPGVDYYGHAGVVDTVTDNGDDTSSVVSVNQNTSVVRLTHTWNHDTKRIGGGLNGYHLVGVVHAPDTVVEEPDGDSPTSLLLNGEFEPGLANWIEAWGPTGSDRIWMSGNPYDGTRSVHLDGDGSWARIQQAVANHPNTGQSFVAEAMVRAPSDTAQVSLTILATGINPTESQQTTITVTDQWTPIRVPLTLGADHTRIQVSISTPAGNTVLIDTTSLS